MLKITLRNWARFTASCGEGRMRWLFMLADMGDTPGAGGRTLAFKSCRSLAALIDCASGVR